MNEILAKKYTWSSALVLTLVLCSLHFNILALTTPFLTIYHVIGSNEVYSLFGAVKLMWGYKLYIIAILIVGFSIIFPFIKLSVLFIVCFVVKKPETRHKLITTVEILGKWSMLDVFVVCILLVLTNNQIFVSSEPNIGVYYFLLAILISIICSLFVDHLCDKTYSVPSKKLTNKLKFLSEELSLVEKVIMVVLLLISIVFFAFAITDNYIQISDFLLMKNSYSILLTCLSLKAISPILAWFVAFVLIIFPFISFNYRFIFWTTSYHPTFHVRISKLIQKLSRFMMLDVFCLALILFLMESSIIIATESRKGLYMLELYVFMSFFIPAFIGVYTFGRYFFSPSYIRVSQLSDNKETLEADTASELEN